MSSPNQCRGDRLLLFSLATTMMISSSFAFQSTISPNSAVRSLTQTNMMDSKSAVDVMLSTMLYQVPGVHSIKPSAKAFADMGITPAKTAADIAPKDASPEYLKSVQDAMDHGWKVTTMDKIEPKGLTLPGFSETHGILPNHNFDLLPPNYQGFAAQLQWSSKYYALFDQLPRAIFLYCLVELFLLRPSIEFYKEDIEADPTGAALDTAAVFGVRVVGIAIVSILSSWLFGTEMKM